MSAAVLCNSRSGSLSGSGQDPTVPATLAIPNSQDSQGG